MVRLNSVDWFRKIIVGSKWNVSQVEFVLEAAFCLEYNLKCMTCPKKKRSYRLEVSFVCAILFDCHIDFFNLM